MSKKSIALVRKYAWLPRFIKKRVNIFFYYTLSIVSFRHYWVFNRVKLGFITAYHHQIAREMAVDFQEDPKAYFEEWSSEAKKSALIYDVGAYNGLYGIAAALANPHATVVIFEPDATNAEQCRKNIALNNVEDRCSVRQVAVSGADGISTFPMQGMTGGRLGEGRETIECVSLDTLPTPNLLKLDVEGEETNILTHASQTLTRKPVVFLELHHWAPRKEELRHAVQAYDFKEFDDRHYKLTPKA